MATKSIPDGYHTITPYLSCSDVDKIINFAKQAFGATETSRLNQPDGKVMHAEIKIGDSIVMLGEQMGDQPPQTTTLYIYVGDCDSVYNQAVKAGGVSMQEPTTMFYGDRGGAVKDPDGNCWWISTHVKDVSPAELEQGAKEWAAANK